MRGFLLRAERDKATLRQPWPGIYLWRAPYGTHSLVDHTGTRRLNAA